MIEYDRETAKKIENNYITPEMMYQRLWTIGGVELRPGEHVLDADVERICLPRKSQ